MKLGEKYFEVSMPPGRTLLDEGIANAKMLRMEFKDSTIYIFLGGEDGRQFVVQFFVQNNSDNKVVEGFCRFANANLTGSAFKDVIEYDLLEGGC